MPQEGMKIEIGGLCALVKTQSPAIYKHVQAQFGGFTSTANPSFTIEFTTCKASPSLRKEPSLQIDINSIRIKPEKNSYRISAEHLRRNNRSKPRIYNIGTISKRKKLCTFAADKKIVSKPFVNSAIFTCFQFFLLNASGFVLHASAVAINNRAFVFSGPSGSGKSTVATRRPGGRVLSDDLVCIRKQGSHFIAHGTPWHSKYRKPSARINVIFFLKHAKSTSFKELSPGSATHELLSNISINVADSAIFEKLLKTVSGLTRKLKCHLMSFSLGDPFWRLIETQYTEIEP